jgi:hypothetical protein
MWQFCIDHPGASSRRVEAAALALAGFEALLGLIDDVDAAFAAHELIVAMASAQ